jgi:hypothetical protein
MRARPLKESGRIHVKKEKQTTGVSCAYGVAGFEVVNGIIGKYQKAHGCFVL